MILINKNNIMSASKIIELQKHFIIESIYLLEIFLFKILNAIGFTLKFIKLCQFQIFYIYLLMESFDKNHFKFINSSLNKILSIIILITFF